MWIFYLFLQLFLESNQLFHVILVLLLKPSFGEFQLFHSPLVLLLVDGILPVLVGVVDAAVHVECSAVQQLHLHSLGCRMQLFVSLLKMKIIFIIFRLEIIQK